MYEYKNMKIQNNLKYSNLKYYNFYLQLKIVK